jgi:DNA-binding HxlR family transcriptional regulator
MKHVSQCHVESTLKVIGGKWKLIILWHLAQGTLRFSELEKRIPGINQKMLTSSLRDLEKDKLVTRKVYAQIPPRVEYIVSQRGVSLGKVLRELDKWGQTHQG